MADEPKPDVAKSDPAVPATPPAGSDSPASAGDPNSPAVSANATTANPTTTDSPTDPAATPPAGDNATPAGGPQPDPLSDGTTPTILKTGDGHRSVPKGKTSLTTLYRRADIMTTLLTFVGAMVAAGAILGVYAYLNRPKTTTTAPTKVTNLDKSELEKLDSFFGGNSAGKSSEILTISSSSLFNNRVAIGSDLKVVGALQVAGPTSLGDLTVDKTSTLGVTNVRGALSVNGPLTVQSAALFNAGASFKGDLSTTGNGSFGGSISAATATIRDLSVNNNLNVNGHLNIGGQNPAASADQAAGSAASATINGNDAAGTVSVKTGTGTANGQLGGSLLKVTFRVPYKTVPTVVITPQGRDAARLQPYILKTADWFIIGIANDATPGTTYAFDYWVVQ